MQSVLEHSSPLPKSIPLKKGLPLIGCALDFSKDSLGFFESLAKEFEDIVLFDFPLGQMGLVCDSEIAHEILVKENKNFRKADYDVGIMGLTLGNGLVTNNNFDSHKTQRKLIQPGFHFRRLESYAQVMSEYTNTIASNWRDGEKRNISNDMFELTMYIVCKTLFDTDMDEMADKANVIGNAMHTFQDVTNKKFRQIIQRPLWLPTKENRQIYSQRKILKNVINRLIESRKLANGQLEDKGDLLSMILTAEYEDGSKMSFKQMEDEILTLFAAGHETTSNALTWTFYLLGKFPEHQEKLFDEIAQVTKGEPASFKHLNELNYTEMVIKESMRLFPPVWVLNARQANNDTVVGGYKVPKDTILFLSPWIYHKNPRHFPNPNEFLPERFDETKNTVIPKHAYVPFGLGGRTCIGNSFALMEAKLILANIVSKFSFKLDEKQKIAPKPQITLSNDGGMNIWLKER